MMTDDLLDRLDPESLTMPVPGGRTILGTETEAEVIAREKLLEQAKFYDHEPEPRRGIPTSVTFELGTPNKKIEFDGTLQLISFGKDGWRVSIDDVDPKTCIELAKSCAGPIWNNYATIYGIVRLWDELDVTIHFGNMNETCSVTIAALQGDAI